jgi:hypothetical protein
VNCQDSGFIQEYIDCELNIEERKAFENHIKTCKNCFSKYEELKENDDFCFTKLNSYAKYIEEKFTFPHSEEKILKEKTYRKEKGVINMFNKYIKSSVAALFIIMCVVIFSVQPVRAAIFDMLSVFRAENVKGLSITAEDIENIATKINSQNVDIDIDKFGKITSEGGENKTVSLDELKADKDVKIVKVIKDFTIGDLRTVKDFSMSFKLNVPNINEFMKAYNAKTLLPKDIDGKTFTFKVPKQVYVNYTKGAQVYYVSQYKKPEILADSDSDIEKIRLALIDSPFLTKDLSNKLKAIKDWKSTLYIPVVGMDVEEIDFAGTKASLFTEDENAKNNKHYYEKDIKTALAWNDNDNIYVVWSYNDNNELLNFAKSLR